MNIRRPRNKYVYVGRRDPVLYALTTEQYCEQTELYLILNQATKHLLRKVQGNPNAMLQEFAQLHLKGEHVLLKPYANISKSPINRLAFLSNFVRVFDGEQTKAVWNGLDYLQLLRLVCSDFPRELVLGALRLSSMDWSSEDQQLFENSYAKTSFIRALYIYFLWPDLVGVIEKHDKSRLKEYFIAVRDLYKGGLIKQLEVPSFYVTAVVLLSLSRQEGSSVIFITEESLIDHLHSDHLPHTAVLQAFFESPLVTQLVAELIDLQDSLANRSSDISKIVFEKGQFALDEKADKKLRKK